MWIIMNKKYFMIFFRQLLTKEYKQVAKRQMVRLQLSEKKSKESQTRLISWYWKWKPTSRKHLITYNIHLWIMFSYNWLVIIWRGGSFVIECSRSRGWKNFRRRWTWGEGGSWKLDTFHGRHMCIIPKYTTVFRKSHGNRSIS